MFVEAKSAEDAAAGGKGQLGLAQSLAQPARRICAQGLTWAICMAVPVVFAQTPPASGPSGAPGQDLHKGVNDPFIQISREVPDCPVPRGFLLTEAQMGGCAASARQADYVAEVLRQLPDVQHVTVDAAVRRTGAAAMRW
ncbi:hypothetical protein RSP673_018500 (plasmid) [Ralstonia solanacearum P673]|uniref:hypothetical protein n=1 Tax=Ralstonia solanacearum TaxID=305 RepID=UPI00044ACE78|nr:hypothetical protein [Ralstonia solanacearum]EUJ12112.1 hypothetical protein RSP673_22830 [Ralstonia solanacearum P673]MCL9850010.1 hypothetical protein [Ralstonia solanacearum]MCL9856305.1 hypothetical protein [Ralstonia solanacearum]MCL9860545.1 hypothetical protein [Ralstonia solanacearum]MCL9865930.1 hypothetical protein [Ralstonia solanacearum]